ncbi:MAG TPA: hypothetical protein VIJ77_12615 [Candidatus Tumulicola sp.]
MVCFTGGGRLVPGSENKLMLASIGPSIVPIVLIALAIGLLPIWFLWRIIDRTGLVGPMALLCFLPGGFVIVLGVVAFSDWPSMQAAQARPIPPQWTPGQPG